MQLTLCKQKNEYHSLKKKKRMMAEETPLNYQHVGTEEIVYKLYSGSKKKKKYQHIQCLCVKIN